jgi:hypothetical protein
VEGEDCDWTALPTNVPVIAPTNEKVDEINNTRLTAFEGEERVYHLHDRFAGKATPGARSSSAFSTDGQEVQEAAVKQRISKQTRLLHELWLKTRAVQLV